MADWSQLPVIIVGALIALFIVVIIIALITPTFIDAKLKDVKNSVETKIDTAINDLRSRLHIGPRP